MASPRTVSERLLLLRAIARQATALKQDLLTLEKAEQFHGSPHLCGNLRDMQGLAAALRRECHIVEESYTEGANG
jgi:hypothetical protein